MKMEHHNPSGLITFKCRLSCNMAESNFSALTQYLKAENRLLFSKLFLWNPNWRISSLHIRNYTTVQTAMRKKLVCPCDSYSAKQFFLPLVQQKIRAMKCDFPKLLHVHGSVRTPFCLTSHYRSWKIIHTYKKSWKSMWRKIWFQTGSFCLA